MDSWNALIRQIVSLANKVSTQKNIPRSIQAALVETVLKTVTQRKVEFQS